MDFHFATAFELIADALPDDPALICGDTTRTWSEFDNLVGHCHRYDPHVLEHALAERGLTIIESAAYGMKPASSSLTEYGMRVMRRNRRRAMRWYNHVFVPLALWFQRPLRFVSGLVDLPSVDEIIAVCRRDN